MISNRIKTAYIEYATEVNIHRALPLMYDGLKTVQRRLLLNGVRICNNQLVKSASIIGETMANNHPHSDASLYETLVNLVNDICPMFTGQGNWGGYKTPCAASRYTAVKLSEFSTDFYLPYLKYAPTYENELGHLENIYIPTLIPYALVNGTSGIGTGTSTRIPAFTKESILEYVKWLLSPSGQSAPELKIAWEDYSIDDSILTEGRGRVLYNLIYESTNIDGTDAFIIKGNPPATDVETLLHKAFSSEIDHNKVFIRNESGKGKVRFIVGKIKWINSDSIESKIKSLSRIIGVHMVWSTGIASYPIARTLSPAQVLEESITKYTKAVDDWKIDRVSKLNLEITFLTKKQKILELLSTNTAWDIIASKLDLTGEEVSYIKNKSLNQILMEKNLLPGIEKQIKKIEKTHYLR